MFTFIVVLTHIFRDILTYFESSLYTYLFRICHVAWNKVIISCSYKPVEPVIHWLSVNKFNYHLRIWHSLNSSQCGIFAWYKWCTYLVQITCWILKTITVKQHSWTKSLDTSHTGYVIHKYLPLFTIHFWTILVIVNNGWNVCPPMKMEVTLLSDF